MRTCISPHNMQHIILQLVTSTLSELARYMQLEWTKGGYDE